MKLSRVDPQRESTPTAGRRYPEPMSHKAKQADVGGKLPLSVHSVEEGLKRYRKMAQQDMLLAPHTPHPEAFLEAARTRHRLYHAYGERLSGGESVDGLLEHALAEYRRLPFAHGLPEGEGGELRGTEQALESLFVLLGLPARARREARSARPRNRA